MGLRIIVEKDLVLNVFSFDVLIIGYMYYNIIKVKLVGGFYVMSILNGFIVDFSFFIIIEVVM